MGYPSTGLEIANRRRYFSAKIFFREVARGIRGNEGKAHKPVNRRNEGVYIYICMPENPLIGLGITTSRLTADFTRPLLFLHDPPRVFFDPLLHGLLRGVSVPTPPTSTRPTRLERHF